MSELLRRLNPLFRLLGLEEFSIEDAKPCLDELEQEYYQQLIVIKKRLEQTLQVAEGIDLQMVIFKEIDVIDAKMQHLRRLSYECK
jgi:hypothetical protein